MIRQANDERRKKMDKTIKEIADAIGVTKQAIFQKIKKEPLSTEMSPYITTKGNRLYISPEGQKLINDSFGYTPPEEENQKGEGAADLEDFDPDEIVFLRDLVLNLQEEKKQLHKLLDQQQQLSLKSEQRIDYLEQQLVLTAPEKTEEKDENEKIKETLAKQQEQIAELQSEWEKKEAELHIELQTKEEALEAEQKKQEELQAALEEQEQQAEKQKKKGFFSRLFGKKDAE